MASTQFQSFLGEHHFLANLVSEIVHMKESESASHSVMSNSLLPHGL